VAPHSNLNDGASHGRSQPQRHTQARQVPRRGPDDHPPDPAKGKKRGRARNAPKFDLRTQLFQMCGVDLTRIDGIDVTTALAVVCEVGADMARQARARRICWLALAMR
jgi:hypothetical protein